jgi:hypothetical protein
LSMKDDSAPQAPRVESRWSSEKKATERSKGVPQGGNEYNKKDEPLGESTMKGNITFS